MTLKNGFIKEMATPVPPRKPKTSNELFYLDEHGEKQDADLCAELLDNPEADRFCLQQAVCDAMARGHTRESAIALYGDPDADCIKNAVPPSNGAPPIPASVPPECLHTVFLRVKPGAPADVEPEVEACYLDCNGQIVVPPQGG